MKSRYFIILIFIATISAGRSENVSNTGSDAMTYSQALLPLPAEQTFGKGVFLMDAATGITGYGREASHIAEWMKEKAGLALGAHITRLEYSTVRNYINLTIRNDTAGFAPEGYSITVAPEEVSITGNDRAGLFYGVQTFLQMLPADAYAPGNIALPVEVPCQTIHDYPRFPYRGMMLDVARTFSDKETVKRFIDRMAMHKLNTLHWHLTDDEGWRIEIESFPGLAELGGFRGGDSPVKHMYGSWGKKYGGYYTHDDIREIVAYAAFRNVEVIPEIELPGHSRAAARVYPQILCAGKVDSLAAGYDMRNVWCANKESNYEMLDSILREVCGLFPSQYIHVGGDEVLRGQWRACPDCKALMESEKYEDAAELTGYFMQKLNGILAKYGKKQAVWNEAVESGELPKDVLVYAWENMGKIKESASEGYPTVMVPAQYLYFDMKYTPSEPGLTWGGLLPTDKTYSFDVSLAGLDEESEKNVAGVQGTLFTELFLSEGPGYLDRQVFPRLCALAELAWSPQHKRDPADFNRRLDTAHFKRLAAMGIGYRRPPVLSDTPKPTKIEPKYTLTSNIDSQHKHPYRYASDHRLATYARSERTCREGDWFLFSFREPLDCDSIYIRTGFTFLPRYNVAEGSIEASYDGEAFEVVEPNFDGRYMFYPQQGLHSIRIKARGEGNGEKAVYIQDLVIY